MDFIFNIQHGGAIADVSMVAHRHCRFISMFSFRRTPHILLWHQGRLQSI